MKVLLTTLNAKYIHLNLAIRLLYELNKHYDGLEWKEYVIKQRPEDIARECAEYEVVAFSCYIWNITQTLKVAECIKAINPSVKILLGGPEVSYEWEEVMAHNCIDYIICGEGEIPFHEFLTHYPDVSQVPNLVYRKNEEIYYQEKAVSYDVSNFTGVNPYINEPVEDLYNKVAYIETSRGCPYKCAFCLASLDNNVRYLPMADIKKNLHYLMTHGRVIKFLDRTFNMKRDFTLEIFQFILDNHKSGNVFQFEITADILHPDIIKFINEQVPKNLFRFEIGIQTVNQKANLEVSRRQNFEKTKSIIKQVQDKVELHLDLIVGLPLDYFDDIKYSFEEVFKLFAPELQLGFLKFLKGTPVRRTANLHGYVYHPIAPYQIIESNYLSKEELQKVTLVEEALEIYWNKNRARNTLKYITTYYSIFDFLLGLGKYFEQHSNFHKHSLRDIYDMLYTYAQKELSDDKVLPQLITADFYLHHKIKPVIRYYPEVAADIKQNIIEQHRLNHHKNRYVVLPVNFNYGEFLQHNQILAQEDYLIFEFDGKKHANVFTTTELLRKARVL